MNRACFLCRGACCESLVLAQIPSDAGIWLSYHGTATPDGKVEFPLPCSKLSECGKCTIHDNRPKICAAFEVGGADCRATVQRRRSNIAHEIFMAMDRAKP